MKKYLAPGVIVFMAVTLLDSCQKLDEFISSDNLYNSHGHLKQTKNYSSEVAIKWMDMQLYLFRLNPAGGTPAVRLFGYSSVALYESVVPGMPAFRSLSGQLTDLPSMPKTKSGQEYFWPECGNAALAAMTRYIFPNASAANKASIDSLENALNDAYKTQSRDEVFRRSQDFGKAIADAVFTWSKSDGAANANAPYTLPVGPGLWVPTPPAFAAAFGPFWGNNRLMVLNSLSGSDPKAPPAYSTDPSSEYYKLVKEVYDISQTLTSEQLAIALFWRDGPGFGGGHYMSILKQILEQEDPNLDISAYAFVKTSIAMVDGGIACFKAKYKYNQERPVTFIRGVLGYNTWLPNVPTPNFPDFPSAHSVNAGAFAEILEGLLGRDYSFTDHSYDYLGMEPRSYSSLKDLTTEIGNARLYGGIHNRMACVEGVEMGRKIARNIDKTIRFKK